MMVPGTVIRPDRKDDEMNDNTGRSHGRRRAGALAAALAGATLLAACGSGNSNSAAGSTPGQKAVAYAQCMRAHGEPGFPDPDSQGNFDLTGKNADPGSPQYLSANKACEHLNPGTPLTAARQREISVKALQWAACIRSHGIPDFADPSVTSGGIKLHGTGHGPPPTAPQYQAAQQACRKLAPLGLP
jgi:hypothetical protein